MRSEGDAILWFIERGGGHLEDVQRHLRHSSRETTDRIYSHLV